MNWKMANSIIATIATFLVLFFAGTAQGSFGGPEPSRNFGNYRSFSFYSDQPGNAASVWMQPGAAPVNPWDEFWFDNDGNFNLPGGLSTKGPVGIGAAHLTANNLDQLTANANFSGTVYLTNQVTLTRNLTLTCDLRPLNGAIITTNGFSLTINGNFEAGPYQVFTSSPGQVTFGVPSVVVDVEWFGAKASNSNSDAATNYNAIMCAISAIPNGLRNVKFASRGTYYTNGGIVYPSSTIFQGLGKVVTKIELANGQNTSLFVNSPGYECFVEFRNLMLDGNIANNTSGSGLFMNQTQTCNNYTLDHVTIENFAGYAIYAVNVNMLIVRECSFAGCGYGTYLKNCPKSAFYSCDWDANTGYDCFIDSANGYSGVTLYQCWIENAGTPEVNNLIIAQPGCSVHGLRLNTPSTLSFPLLITDTATNCMVTNTQTTNAPSMTKLPFTSGTTSPALGDTIAGATSGATGKVGLVQIQTGSWTGSNAAGYLYLYSVTGTFNSSEQLNDTTTSSTNFASTNGSSTTYGVNIGITQGSRQNFIADTAGGGLNNVVDGNGSSYVMDQYNSSWWRKSGRVFETPMPLDTSGTPDVSKGNVFQTNGPSTITNFLNGQPGQTITVYCHHTTIVNNSATIATGSGGNMQFLTGDVISFTLDGGTWKQVGGPGIKNTCSGIATLVSGAVTVTNSCLSGSRPVICTDQTNVNAVKCAPSAGSLAITGNASDVISWAQQ